MASINTVKFRSDLALELELTAIRRILDTNAPALFAPSRAGFYHIIWIERGQAVHLVDFKPVLLASGTLLFVGPSRVHTFDKTADYDGQMILFTDAFFARSEADRQFLHMTTLFQDWLDSPAVPVGREDITFTTLFAQFATELSQVPDACQPVILQNLLHNLLLLAERIKQQDDPLFEQGPDLHYTLLFRNLVEEQFKTLRSVHKYAGQLSVSEKRLAQATSRTLGKQPKKVIDERVTLEAKRLLVHTRASIKEISFDLGFEEPTNFIKFFRRQVSLTPTEFRALPLA
ncbi:AraC family transcriptional regulator [Spirosoma koreense]